MGIISKTATVKIGKRNFGYYKKLGYKFNHVGDEIEVKVKDLLNGSHVRLLVCCENCNNKKEVVYKNYTTALDKTGHYYCRSCANTIFLTGKPKVNRTNWEGVGRKKGYVRSEETKKKFIATMEERYGVKNPAQSKEFLEKAAKTYHKNSSKECSKQQFYIYSLYNIDNSAKLNYPISYFNADICFTNEKLVCEYDGGGHLLSVITGKITKEEHFKKELVRYSIIKREGYKQMRIISTKDFLPSDQILLQMLSDTRNYFFEYQNHSWIEFNIDESIVRNAECKNGTLYNYGELRTIKI